MVKKVIISTDILQLHMHRHTKTGLQENVRLTAPVAGAPVAVVLVGSVVEVSALRNVNGHQYYDPTNFIKLIRSYILFVQDQRPRVNTVEPPIPDSLNCRLHNYLDKHA